MKLSFHTISRCHSL